MKLQFEVFLFETANERSGEMQIAHRLDGPLVKRQMSEGTFANSNGKPEEEEIPELNTAIYCN